MPKKMGIGNFYNIFEYLLLVWKQKDNNKHFNVLFFIFIFYITQKILLNSIF